MKRIADHQARAAMKVLPEARANGDAAVVAACVRVREAWMLGRRVAAADVALVLAFA